MCSPKPTSWVSRRSPALPNAPTAPLWWWASFDRDTPAKVTHTLYNTHTLHKTHGVTPSLQYTHSVRNYIKHTHYTVYTPFNTHTLWVTLYIVHTICTIHATAQFTLCTQFFYNFFNRMCRTVGYISVHYFRFEHFSFWPFVYLEVENLSRNFKVLSYKVLLGRTCLINTSCFQTHK